MSKVLTWEEWFDLAKPSMDLFPISDPTMAYKAWLNSQIGVPKRVGSVDAHVVYFLKCHDFCKIGFTRNLRDRMCMLQCGCPYDISLVYFIPTESKEEASKVEKWVHEELDKARGRHKREWFDYEKTARLIHWLNMAESERYRDAV